MLVVNPVTGLVEPAFVTKTFTRVRVRSEFRCRLVTANPPVPPDPELPCSPDVEFQFGSFESR